ncbi:MAG: hypothetical protein KF781_07215 [Chitinophagaceae bacterium]|nr:hypothetical protein [Chitinophagaceae bacterium]MCW5903987.1 hypothetical protein [Chitinophagaceae bacterium]
MADNAPNNHVDNANISEAANIEGNEAAIINQNQEKENMEVHHPHSSHGNKKFKDYFLEFLTLFIAVTMGFFAENIREGKVERHREKEYIESMVKELKADSLQITKVFQDTIVIRKLDSLAVLLLSNQHSSDVVRKMYQLHYRYARGFEPMTFNRNTLTQLKNSGNMRLIRKQSVVESMNTLDNKITDINEQREVLKEIMLSSVKNAFSIFDESYFIQNGIITGGINPVLYPGIKLLTNDKVQLHKFGAEISFSSVVIIGYFYMLQDIYEYQNQLIHLLKKEYHLE